MDFARRYENQSWATVEALPTTDRFGNDVLLLVAKVSYGVSAEGAVELSYRPIRWSDVADEGGGIRYPAELVVEKPGTDLGLVGTAHPSGLKGAADRFLAWVSMGPLRKVVHVIGARKYSVSHGRSSPGPASRVGPTPLRYDLCFGGTEPAKSDDSFSTPEPWNPIGRGFVTDAQLLDGRPAPQLEPVTEIGAVSQAHGCFAPLPAHWEPRRSRIGTRDATWLRTRAPTPPLDMDELFGCWAVPELHSATPLIGDEAVEVGGVLPEGVWRFSLPKYQPTFGTATNDGWHRWKTHMDSVLIDADAKVVELTWRVALPLPRPWEKLARVRIWSDTPMPREVLPTPASTSLPSNSSRFNGQPRSEG